MKYTDLEFIEAVKSSFSIRQVLIKIGLAPKGGNYKTVHNLIDKLKLDTSHFKGQGWSKDSVIGPKRPIEDYLDNTQTIQSYKLKKRLLMDGIFEHQCSCCGITEWLKQPAPLELDHVDGNSQNNALSNLRLLCPNCHAFTSTYRGKNISKT